MKSKVYIESSVVSYYTARPSRNIVVAARQKLTCEYWLKIREEFECYISLLVLQEVKAGDPMAATERIEALIGIPVLEIDPAAEELAEHLIVDSPIPEQYPEDALHIAIAARDGIDYLLTWNFAHIHNAQMENSIRRVVERYGYQCPVFCSPDELVGE